MSKFPLSLAFFHTFRKYIIAHQIIISPYPRDVYVCLKNKLVSWHFSHFVEVWLRRFNMFRCPLKRSF